MIGLEAKGDEIFGPTLAAHHAAAPKLIEKRKPTNAPARLQGLTLDLAGTTIERNPALAKLHYQLFSGVAGTLAAAAEVKIDLVAFVVHDFETRETKPHKQANNRSALADFMVRVFGRTTPSPDDKWWLRGPFTVPGSAGRLSLSGSAISPHEVCRPARSRAPD